jgi:hypothetical protein
MNKQNLGDKAVSIIGGGVGAAIGLFGGPPGAIAGGALGAAFTDILRDVAKRMLSDKEKLRVESASNYIAEGIMEKLNSGFIVRQDNFFEGDANFTSNGAELLEGVLLKCKEQYQERKVKFISNIFKNAAFNTDISPQAAYQAISIAEALTYQKFCLLSYCGRKEDFADFNILKDPTSWYDKFQVPPAMDIAIQDLLEMHYQGLLTNQFGMTVSNSVVPGTMGLTAKGQMAFDLMELGQVERNDVMTAIRPLEFPQHWGISSNRTLNGIRQTGS